MSDNNPLLLEDHLIPALERRTYGRTVVWENQKEQIFRLPWCGKYRPGTRHWREEYAEWCLDWDRKRGRIVSSEASFVSKSKERIRNALRKSKWVKVLPMKDGCRRYQSIGFKVRSSTCSLSNNGQEVYEKSPLSAQSVCGSDTSGYESDRPMDNSTVKDKGEPLGLPEPVDELNRRVSPFNTCVRMENSTPEDFPSPVSADTKTSNLSQGETSRCSLPVNENNEIVSSQSYTIQFVGCSTLENVFTPKDWVGYADRKATTTVPFTDHQEVSFQPQSGTGTCQETGGIVTNQEIVKNVIPDIGEVPNFPIQCTESRADTTWLEDLLEIFRAGEKDNDVATAVQSENSQQSFAQESANNSTEDFGRILRSCEMEWKTPVYEGTIENTVFEEAMVNQFHFGLEFGQPLC